MLTSHLQESLHSGEGMSAALNASKDHMGVILNESRNKSSSSTNTKLCKRALFKVLTSAKFSELCDLLIGNFQGLKVSSLFDINTIQSRVKEGAYESSPLLFHHDIQQVSHKFVYSLLRAFSSYYDIIMMERMHFFLYLVLH